MKDNTLLKIIGIGLVIFLGIAFYEYMFTKESHEGAITGLQALQQQGTEFWIFAIFGTVGAAVATILLLRKVKDMGGFGVSLKAIVPIIAFMAIAWGGTFTDKANDGVTSAKGRPIPAKIDSTRVAAEDLLPK